MEQEEAGSTNISETEMKKAIKGIEKNMEQLETLHNNNDHMKEQLDRMMTIVTTIRGMVGKWSRNEYTHSVGNEAEVMRAQVSMEQGDTGDVEAQTEGREAALNQQQIEKDILN
eukprot:13437317-Heterocapsa_arctica.AAC.1